MNPPKRLHGEALEFWKRNTNTLISQGFLNLEYDFDAYTLLCVAWGKVVEAEAAGLDAIKWVALSKQVQNMLKSFGLDPASRKRLGIRLAKNTVDEFGLEEV